MWDLSAAKLGATMAIGELFSFREWDDTSWSVTAECRGLSAVFFPPAAERPQARERREAHAQSCSSAETLRAVIVNMVSGAANLRKSVMPLAID